MTTDWPALYREHVADLTALAGGLNDDQLARVVPATPEWTVREVYAHLAGGASDATTGRMDGAPSPSWSARHVGERCGVPVADLVTELAAHQDRIAAAVADSPRPAIVWDIAVHHADIHEALGLHRLAEHLWRPVVDTLAPRLPAGLLEDVDPYEVFRACFSRRSRGQMRAWGSSATPDQLDRMCIFGPRDDDQPVPEA